MTTQAHDHSVHEAPSRPVVPAAGRGAVRQAAHPRWLWPGVAAAIVVTGLVVAGVLSISIVLYAGAFGGMLLMHAGGHGGHGGHGGSGGHEDHGSGTTSGTDPLSHGSHGSQPARQDSAVGLDDRATNGAEASETERP